MRKLLALAAVGVTAVVAPPAQAHPEYHYTGGCRYIAVQQSDVSSTYDGVMVAAVVAMRHDQIRLAPTAPINVKCEIRMGGVVLSETLQSPTTPGAAAIAGAASYTGDRSAVIELCTIVEVVGEVHEDCVWRTQAQVLPQEAIDIVEEEVLPIVDSTLCFVLGIFAPGVPGVVDVTPEGDLTVAGHLVYDCGNPSLPAAPAYVDYVL